MKGKEHNIGDKTIVFTAYLQEEHYSKEAMEMYPEDAENPASDNWYPTIFFFDLREKRVVWEIFGAEIFIGIDINKKVTVLTNEIWVEID